MGINSLGEVWQNALSFLVVFFVLFWIYKNMYDTPFKRWIAETIEKMKEAFNDDE